MAVGCRDSRRYGLIGRLLAAIRGAVLLILSVSTLMPEVLVARAAADERREVLSLVGAPRLDPAKGHFDWVNPRAPKGGSVHMWANGSFDTLNPFSVSGDKASGLGALMYDSLMSSNPDEPSTEYCLVCEWVSHPQDFSSVTFKLRAQARFHDGMPITADDVIFSFHALQKGLPFYRHYYKNVERIERHDDHRLTFHFNAKGNRELPQIMGQLYILPKHYWEGASRGGTPRDITKSTLEAPLGSGPYRIKSFVATREIIYERVENWWAKDLAIMRGQWNFDEIRFTYFRDRTPAFEAFKVGMIDFWLENSASAWATRFDFGAVRRGLVSREEVPIDRVAGMQGFVMNGRRAKFRDERVRKALNLIFDFEFANRAMFYGQYKRLASFFDNSELAATGRPVGRELEILETVRDKVPPEVFGELWSPPVQASRADIRRNMHQASKLLDEAGWRLEESGRTGACDMLCSLLVKVGLKSSADQSVRRNAQGESLSVEFLLMYGGGMDRVALPYIRNLEMLGIPASVRVVDSAQYVRRMQTFDFDVMVANFPQSNSPGNEQRGFFGSGSADQQGSRNLAGIQNPAIDKVIERLILATDREDLVAATRAMDRLLIWNFYVVPQWYIPTERIAYWKRFGRPDRLPSQEPAFLRAWWHDQKAAATLDAARGR